MSSTALSPESVSAPLPETVLTIENLRSLNQCFMDNLREQSIELHTAEGKCEELEKDIKILRSRLKMEREKAKEAEDIKRKALETASETRAECLELEEKIKEITAENTRLSSALKLAEERIHRLQRLQAEQEAEMAGKDERYSALFQEKIKLSEQLDTFLEEDKLRRDQMRKMEENLNAKAKCIVALRSNIHQLETGIWRQKGTVQNLTKALKQKQDKLQALSASQQSWEDRARILEDDNRRITEELMRKQEELQVFRVTRKSLEDRIGLLEENKIQLLEELKKKRPTAHPKPEKSLLEQQVRSLNHSVQCLDFTRIQLLQSNAQFMEKQALLELEIHNKVLALQTAEEAKIKAEEICRKQESLSQQMVRDCEYWKDRYFLLQSETHAIASYKTKLESTVGKLHIEIDHLKAEVFDLKAHLQRSEDTLFQHKVLMKQKVEPSRDIAIVAIPCAGAGGEWPCESMPFWMSLERIQAAVETLCAFDQE